MSPLFRAFRALSRLPVASIVAATVLIVGLVVWLILPHHSTPRVVSAANVGASLSTGLPADTPTVDPLATATSTPLPGPTSTPDPLATATNTPIPPPPAPTATTIGDYQAPLLPVELTISPTTISGVCAAGQLPQITVTQTGGTDPIGWNAVASPQVDLNPGSSSANGDNPMVPGKMQHIGFSFGDPFAAGTVITITVIQAQLTTPEMTRTAGTVTVNCQ